MTPRRPNVEQEYPLSPIQEGMLAHSLLELGDGVDIVQIACRFREAILAAPFAAAWAEIIRRHPIFRTRFQWRDRPAPVQQVLESVPTAWEDHDWSEASPEEQDRRFAALLQAERQRGFSLDEAPLERFHLIRCGPVDFRFAFTFHHAVLDGSSFPLVAREAFALYEALVQGKAPDLPPAVPFRQYVDWLAASDQRASEGIWRTRLAGFTHPTPLPGNPAPAERSHSAERYGERELFLTEPVSREVEAFAKAHGLTLNTITQAAWALLLGRHAGSRDVVFGVTRRCRHIPVDGAERIVGPLLNTVPMRVSLDPDAEVTAWLKDLRRQWQELETVEHTPPSLVQAWSEAPRGTPLYETIAVFETSPLDEGMHRLGGPWERRDFWAHHQTNFPITLNGYAGRRLRLRIIYDARRFEPGPIDRLLGHLGTLIEGMTSAAATTVGSLPMITVAERSLLVEEWNRTDTPYPADLTLTALLERQAEASPAAVATRFDGTDLSYADLHARANQLAHHLRSLGVGPGQLVGVCAERSHELVIALLAVLKAGGAYVPLDPEYPRDRLDYMLADAAPRVLLTEAKVAAAIPPHDGVTVSLDGDRAQFAGYPTSAPPATSGPDDLAYMIYTSGSTGRPKGALNAHRGIVNRLLWMQDAFRLGPSDAVLQKTPFSFDVSVWEFFWPLMTGARLVVARPGGHRDSSYLCATIRREGVTVLHFVPSMLRAFLADPAAADCTGIRDIMCSGEALPPELVARALGLLPARLQNLYGPTEAAVDVTWRQCEPADGTGATVPIGRPIANTQTYILDSAGSPVPIGVPGELFLGGVQVGVGYWKRPDLTAERFVPDRFRPGPGRRLYRTGDLARYREDGAIEFLGRLDDQVKIRGFRIELGEIESVMAQQPGVRAAAVVVQRDGPSEPRLVGYFCADAESADPELLRSALLRILPDYMVPAALMRLDALPLSPNGKLDRRALPNPASVQTERRDRTAPRTEAERTLAAIWGDLLRRSDIGINENFFELGGDSILSIYVAVRARAAGLDIAPRDVLKQATIAELAAVAERADGGRVKRGIPEGPVPLTPVQRWFFEWPHARNDHWNQAFNFVVPAGVDADRFRTAFARATAHHDAFRLRFRREASGWTQEYASGPGACDLTVTAIGGTEEAERQAIERAAAGLNAGLDLEHGPVIRAALLTFGTGRPGRLLIAAHHLVIDGISWRILLEDVESAYQQLGRGQTVTLPPRTSSFAEWSAGLAALATREDLRAEASHWTKVLAGGAARLPVRGGSDTEGAAATVVVALDEGETTALLRSAPAAYRTQVNDLLLTALGSAMRDWIGDGELLVDVEGHGREETDAAIDVSRTIGWFTTIYPVRLPLRGDDQTGRRLLATKEILRSVPRRGIGYGVLRYLSGNVLAGETDEAQILFNYLGQFDHLVAGSTLFAFGPESAGPWRAAAERRRHPVEINAMVVGGRLEIHWRYGPASLAREAVEQAATAMRDELRRIVTHCLTPAAGGRSPSDFPLVRLSQAAVDRLAGDGRQVEDLLPLAPMQSLFLATSGSGADVGFEQWRYSLSGPVDADALRRAWQLTVNRHAILRTAFVTEEGTPVQVVRTEAELPFQVLDWRNLPPDVQTERLAAWLAADRALGFATAQAPLMRVGLIRLGESRWELVWSHHHLLLDRWSWPIVLREVGTIHQALQRGVAPALEPAPAWRDYVGWLAGQDAGESEAFWRSELAGFAAAGLRATRHPPAADGEVRLELTAEQSSRLAGWARERRTTINTVITAAWALWVARATDSTDVIIGLTVAGRPGTVPGITGLVGMCMNNVAARLRFDRAEPVATVVDRLGDRLAALAPHEHTDLLDLQRWSGLPWHRRLFDTLLVFQHHGAEADRDRWLGEEIGIEMPPVATPTNFPLALIVTGSDRISLGLAYHGRYTDAAGATAILGQVRELLVALPERWARPVAETLDLLPAPAGGDSAARRTIAPPRTATEWVVARIWADLLGLAEVGIDESFFDLGGHSLVATQIMSRVRDNFRMELPVSLLFTYPTVAAFAVAVQARERAPGQVERIAAIVRRVEMMSAAEVHAATEGANV